MATEGATTKSSSSSADSYIGSLISLTSKSEIRYEGVLYSINTEESSIGLRNVRSYGTEGRKKDGPQVPAGDKVYEYILFRGSDIKDLQVKSSPPVQPVQPTPPINNDPAIIQSHYSHPSSTSTAFPPTITGPLADTNPITTQMGLPGANFQGSLPLYHPGGSIGSWGPSPAPPGANANGMAMPMYYQGFYGPPNGLPQLHQQPLFRPPPGLSMPPPMQQPMQYTGFNNSLSTGASNFTHSNLPELPPSLQPAGTSSINLTTTSILPSTLSSSVPTVPSSTPAPETFPNFMQNKAPVSAPVSPPLFPLSSMATSGPDVNVVVPQISNSVKANPGPNLPYQTMSQSVSSFLGTSKSSISEAPTPSLVTPGQLLKSEPTSVPLSQALQADQKDVEVVKVSSAPEPLVPVSTEAQPPILPLPTPSRAAPKVNGTPSPARQGNKGSESHGYRGSESHGYRGSESHGYRGSERSRGRGRGRGMVGSRPAVKFTEEFDFMAMNEKFNKDEVWGDLGKNNRSSSRDKDGDGNMSDENDYQEDDDSESSVKPVYNKDDFFDTISCNALDRESNNGRTRFSEQMKIDTETFGEFARYRGGRGGRGFNRGGGRPHGGYYGRGYGGYNSRGRGRGYSNQAIN